MCNCEQGLVDLVYYTGIVHTPQTAQAYLAPEVAPHSYARQACLSSQTTRLPMLFPCAQDILLNMLTKGTETLLAVPPLDSLSVTCDSLSANSNKVTQFTVDTVLHICLIPHTTNLDTLSAALSSG